MSRVFVDTSFYVAVTVPNDQLHPRATQWMQGYTGTVVTTDFVVVELANFFSRSHQRATFAGLYEYLAGDANVEIVPATRKLLDRGIEFYLNRRDKSWSLTDCISFVVMKDQAITEALTADHHFQQAGFVPLLA